MLTRLISCVFVLFVICVSVSCANIFGEEQGTSGVYGEKLLPPGERVVNSTVSTIDYYGASRFSPDPMVNVESESVMGDFIVVRLSNRAKVTNKIKIEDKWILADKLEDMSYFGPDEADVVSETLVDIPPKKTVTVKIPIIDRPGKWAYRGSIISETFPE